MIIQEIEKKFLVVGDYKSLAVKSFDIKQAYICKSNGKTVRIRTKNDKAYLTIKDPSTDNGLSRTEFEIEIDLNDADILFELAENNLILKKRYIVPWKEHVIEIDEFSGLNAGLVVAEIELNSIDEQVELPDFLGLEVTGKPQFYNSFLSKLPYLNWIDKENFTP